VGVHDVLLRRKVEGFSCRFVRRCPPGTWQGWGPRHRLLPLDSATRLCAPSKRAVESEVPASKIDGYYVATPGANRS